MRSLSSIITNRSPLIVVLFAAAASSLALLSGCAVGGETICPDDADPFTEFNVYFGQQKGDGTIVTADEWSNFLADVITPHFPAGLTLFDARGQWLDTDEGRLYQESTMVLNVLVPADSADDGLASVQTISDFYKDRFDQQAVFFTTSSACAALY